LFDPRRDRHVDLEPGDRFLGVTRPVARCAATPRRARSCGDPVEVVGVVRADGEPEQLAGRRLREAQLLAAVRGGARATSRRASSGCRRTTVM
jgi:hypothetical protein